MAGILKTSNKTKLHNDTSFEISLKTGNAGIWSSTAKIPIGGHYVVKSTANETYKEYWCAVQPTDDKDVILSSDDCIEFQEIVIKPTAPGSAKFDWEGTVKRDGSPVTPVVANTSPAVPPAAGTNPGFFGRLWGKISGH